MGHCSNRPKARRQLQEHLRASAGFILRHNGQEHLLQALQQDVLRRARHRHPGFEQLDRRRTMAGARPPDRPTDATPSARP